MIHNKNEEGRKQLLLDNCVWLSGRMHIEERRTIERRVAASVKAKIHRFSVCDSNSWIGLNPRVVVTPFAPRHLCVFVRRLVLGHSAWLLASLVGTYGVFVPRSVLGHSA